MKIRAKVWIVIIIFLVAAGLIIDCWSPVKLVTTDAEARIGRPLTPLSYAGVARRTRRRIIRRTAIYINTLPRGCSNIRIEGITLQQCGNAYYQSHGNRYMQVYVD